MMATQEKSVEPAGIVEELVARIFDKFDYDAYLGGPIAYHNSYRYDGSLSERSVTTIQKQLLAEGWNIAIQRGRDQNGPHVIFIGDKRKP